MKQTTVTPLCPCCRINAMAWWPAAMGADRRTPVGMDGPAPSFSDQTASERTGYVSAGDANTRDLFEQLDADRWLAIRGATVLPMTKDERLSNCTVLIRNGVIRAVQPAGERVPEGARVIDAKGKFIIPGLSEMHAHPMLARTAEVYASAVGAGSNTEGLVLPYDLQMFLYLAAGVTRIEIMLGTAEELALRDAIRRGQIRGPAMRVASPLIDGFPASFPPAVAWTVGDADGARRAAQTIVERGYEFAKPYTRLSREAHAALVDECERLGIDVMGHIPKDVGTEAALAAGQRGVAHMFEFFYYDPSESKGDVDRFQRYARLARQHGVTVQTTLCAAHLLEHDFGHARNDPRTRQFLDPMMNFMMGDESTFVQMSRSDPELVEAVRNIRRLSNEMAKALVAEGVTLLPGTDMPGSNVTQGFSLQEELRLMVEEVGIAPLDVLRSATVTSALCHGEGGKAGQIVGGQRSDLVILNQDPSVDIRATAAIETVVLGRNLLTNEARERGIARAVERYKAMPVPVPAG